MKRTHSAFSLLTAVSAFISISVGLTPTAVARLAGIVTCVRHYACSYHARMG